MTGNVSHGKKTIVWIIVIFLAFCVIASNRNRDDADTSATTTTTAKATSKVTSTPRITNTPRPTNTPKPTKTPKPTATPTPTPTAAPDFANMTPVDAAQVLADYYRDDMTITEIVHKADNVRITLHSGSYASAKSFVRTRCRVMINVAKVLFENEGFHSMTMAFTVPGYDKYGNDTTITAMTITLYRETSEKINYEYMYNNLGSTTERFLQITDAYYVHPDLQEGVF